MAITVFAPRMSVAQAVSPADRDALVRLYVDRGGRDADLDIVLRRIDEAAAKSLPTAPLLNKVREGVVKGYKSDRIDVVVQQMVANLDAADGLLRELNPAAAGTEREASIALLAESLDQRANISDA